MDGVVSVVVPVYNVEKFLEECLESVVSQSYTNLEIILIDDGSTDASGKICDEWAAKDSRIRLIHKPNGGLSSARNTGIEMATGEYIAFVDSDDYLDKDAIKNLYECAEKNSADLVVAQGQRVNEEGVPFKDGKYGPAREILGGDKEITKEDFFKRFSDNLYFIVVWSKLYSRKLLESIRFPEGKINEDVTVSAQTAARAQKIVFLDVMVYNYRIRLGSIQRSKFEARNLYVIEALKEVIDYSLDSDFSAEGKYYITRIQFSDAMDYLTRGHIALDKDKELKAKMHELYVKYKPVAKALLKGIDGSVKVGFSTKITMIIFLISEKLFFSFKKRKFGGDQ